MRVFISIFLIAFLASCMSDKEFMLRKEQLSNQAKHQQTYSPLTLQGPASFNLQAGSKLEVRSETQPFQVVEIPDGQKYQADIVKTTAGIAAGTFLGYRALKEADAPVKVITKEAGK